ncbi:peptide chain release factor N(5)-glutamine methyltransferase [Uliginosibacterium sp. sgz301328]|uniref:peptide chain release factor N(5)-glutamine methyltransferase n=1 Tax=Uliginosibacterium sp. sgz301328 TaxID=3243764 RepID=UPI00359F07DE
MDFTTLGEALAFARARIDVVDAKVLLRYAADVTASTLAAYPERALNCEQAMRFAEWVGRREYGEPVAHIIGEREFFGRMFHVTADTLIPRPDTEIAIERALECLHNVASPDVLDLGTGSGVIAITLALECPSADVTAIDASAAALTVAKQNASALGARLRSLAGSWFEPVKGERFHLIVSNPPYIEEQDVHLSRGDVRFEPRTALASGADGLDDIRHIVRQAPAHLATGGWLVLEHGYDQASRVRALLVHAGFVDVSSRRDLAGIERVTSGRIDTR